MIAIIIAIVIFSACSEESEWGAIQDQWHERCSLAVLASIRPNKPTNPSRPPLSRNNHLCRKPLSSHGPAHPTVTFASPILMISSTFFERGEPWHWQPSKGSLQANAIIIWPTDQLELGYYISFAWFDFTTRITRPLPSSVIVLINSMTMSMKIDNVYK